MYQMLKSGHCQGDGNGTPFEIHIACSTAREDHHHAVDAVIHKSPLEWK